MALTNFQALDVVTGCVHGVSGRAPLPTDTLEDGGIVDASRLRAWRSLVVANPKLGVRKYGHRIDAAALNDVATDGTLQEAADVVEVNAEAVDAIAAMPEVDPAERVRPAPGGPGHEGTKEREGARRKGRRS